MRDDVGIEARGAQGTNRDCCPRCGLTDLKIVAHKQYRERNYSLARCGVCEQHFCHPTPSPEEIVEFYVEEYHQELRVDGADDEALATKFKGYRDWVLEFVDGGRSLDIGTATGLMPALLKQAGFDAEGIEYNEASAKYGEEHYRVRIHVGDFLQRRAELGSFDFISMTDVLEHAYHPLEFLRTVREHLEPGGWMLVTFPDIQSIESRYVRLWSRLLRRDWIWYCCHIPGHVWEFTPATARAMFEEAGLEVAAFRRRAGKTKTSVPILKLLFLPMKLLQIPAIGNSFGTQMQFMLRYNTKRTG
jgi:2-polyprenyl-3-methyl-5-hydroxy-6-metoxy-1,4-benzoquinol methylase